jgi:3-hydroxybutyryl-CoA dehydratase
MKIRVGDKYSKLFVISEIMINGFATCTGDKNPVHLDEAYASKTVFKKRIAHGFLVGSLISSVLGNDYPGNGTIYLSQNMRFLKPVFIGDKIEVNIEVNDISEKNWVNLKTLCINQDLKIVIDGDATIIPPSNCELIRF